MTTDCTVLNEKVIGKFKDETLGAPITEFVGLRPKMYSFLTLVDPATGATKGKHRAKGIQYAASAQQLRHANYLEQLERPAENRISNKRIGSKLHVIYSMSVEKRALCAFDDKRFLLEDGAHTLAYGHRDITTRVAVVAGVPDAGDLVLAAPSPVGAPHNAALVLPAPST